MSFFDVVEAEVRGYSRGEVSVRNYRLSLAEAAHSELGVESNRQGSPYAPLTSSELAGGGFLVEWTDGLVSRGAVSRAPRKFLREVIESAFHGRHEDRDGAVFPGVSEVPEVAIHSPECAEIAEGRRPEALAEVLGAIGEVARGHGVKLLDAGAKATRMRRRTVSSGGFRADSESTLVGISAAFDSLIWDSHSFREPPAIREITAAAERTAEDYEALREKAGSTPRGPTSVILHPRVAESFLRLFLLGNLSGGAVANGRSRFTVEDFREQKRWFREDLHLSSHPLRPMGTGSFRFTEEGVPARDVVFVDGGRLVTPSLGLKYAGRLGLAPAPLPADFDGLRLSLGSSLGREEALASAETVVVVHGVLGLHTQDAVRAEYSVLSPHSVVHRAGKPAGRVSVTLNGSFFDDMTSPDLAFVQYPGFAAPGMMLRTDLT